MGKMLTLNIAGRLAVIGIAVLAWASGVKADVTIRETVTHYTVDAASLPGLRSQMARKGPRGFWGYARWSVWSEADCDVILRVTYTLPRHIRPEVLTPGDRAAWDRMLTALEQHERNHGAHGLAAAQELEAAGCKGRLRIIRKWAKEDRLYDERTRHGRLEGVTLP